MPNAVLTDAIDRLASREDLPAADAGCAVAKHGNRSATGRSGSADVLEALGARIDLGPEAVASCIDECGFGFMFAPHHHQAMRHVVPVRKELAVRTIFNFLGPLTNPAGATRQVIGVSDAAFLETIAGALARLGAERALVVSSAEGVRRIFAGEPGPARELAVLNAGAAVYVSGRVDSLQDGVRAAEAAIDSGAAAAALQRLVALTGELAPR